MSSARAAGVMCVVALLSAGCGDSGSSSSSATTQAGSPTSATDTQATSTQANTTTAPVSPGQNAANQLGVTIATTTAGQPGVVVKSIAPDKKTLLREGDVIVAYNGKPVSSVEQLGRLIGTPAIGEEFEITVIRGSRRLNFREVASSTTYLGVDVQDAEGDTGAKVVKAAPGSPAAKAGLEPDDVITAVDETPVRRVKDLLQAVSTHSPGDTVTITFTRGSRELKAKTVLTTRP
jgi:putative serine protease PepD